MQFSIFCVTNDSLLTQCISPLCSIMKENLHTKQSMENSKETTNNQPDYSKQQLKPILATASRNPTRLHSQQPSVTLLISTLVQRALSLLTFSSCCLSISVSHALHSGGSDTDRHANPLP